MGTALALALIVFLAAAGWWVYLQTGARRWTTERDPLGEPPVRMAALIGAIVLAVALVSTGGGGAKPSSAMQQGLEDSDSDDLFSGVDGAEVAGAATDETPAAATKPTGDGTSAVERESTGRSPTVTTKPAAAKATQTAKAAKVDRAPQVDRATGSERRGGKDDLPSYGKLVVRARKAAEARGAEIHWYPTVAAEAAAASKRR